MIIRREEERDYFEVENLTREAFWNVYQPGCMEHYVLHKLRSDPVFVPALDYLIEEEGKIVAHIAYAHATLSTEDGLQKVLLFGPVSVLPTYQDKGYGTKLIEFTLIEAKRLGYPVVCITGNPSYYSRFGFETASKYGIFYEDMGEEAEATFFMVKFLDESAKGQIKGRYRDPACYAADNEAVEEFDRQFSPKVKEKRPNQLR